MSEIEEVNEQIEKTVKKWKAEGTIMQEFGVFLYLWANDRADATHPITGEEYHAVKQFLSGIHEGRAS